MNIMYTKKGKFQKYREKCDKCYKRFQLTGRVF